jgi:hypothetical protein
VAMDHSRYLATETMFSRWRLSETDAADAFSGVAERLRVLCVNPPTIDHGYAFGLQRISP